MDIRLIMVKDDDLSDEDSALFRASVAGTMPLQKGVRREPKFIPKSTATFSRRPRVVTSDAPSRTRFLMSNIVEPVQAETILSFCRSGVSKKQIQALKNGHHAIEARLDLHGCIPDEAETALCAFIDKCFALHQRHVLIIHGKGGRHGEAPVIKNLVYRWLPQISQILAFHSALPKQGGSGALYVLLKTSTKDS